MVTNYPCKTSWQMVIYKMRLSLLVHSWPRDEWPNKWEFPSLWPITPVQRLTYGVGGTVQGKGGTFTLFEDFGGDGARSLRGVGFSDVLLFSLHFDLSSPTGITEYLQWTRYNQKQYPVTFDLLKTSLLFTNITRRTLKCLSLKMNLQ